MNDQRVTHSQRTIAEAIARRLSAFYQGRAGVETVGNMVVAWFANDDHCREAFLATGYRWPVRVISKRGRKLYLET